MKLKYTILYVDDVAASLDFFVKAFDVAKRMLHEGGDYGELATGETTLAFSSKKLMRQIGKTPGQANQHAPVFELAFETTDVTGALARALAAGATLVQGVTEQPWGQTLAYVSDANGFLIELCSPVRSQV